MKYMVTVQHPAQVHFFRHAVRELREEGNDVRVYARRRDVVGDLLAAYDIPHRVLARTPDEDDALERAEALAADPTTGEEWRRRRDRLLADEIDVTEYVVDVLLEVGCTARERRPDGNRDVRGRVRNLLTGGGPG